MESELLSPENLPQSRQRQVMPSWIASAVIHAVVLIIVGLMWQFTPRGIAEEPDRAAGIVLRKHTPQGDFFEDADETFTAESTAAASNSPPKTELLDEAAPDAHLAGLIPKPPKIGAGGLGGDAPGVSEDPTGGTGKVRLPGGRIRTNIYGLEGEGRNFVYVFDRSFSMHGRPLDSAKAQLMGSVDHLDRIHQFAIIFYNNGMTAFNKGRVSFGDNASKNRARKFVHGIVAVGATKHYPALMKALELSHDVIFLLTDGRELDDLTDDELKEIRKENSGGTQIHVIQFVRGEVHKDGNSLIQLAEENGGKHKYVNTSNFK